MQVRDWTESFGLVQDRRGGLLLDIDRRPGDAGVWHRHDRSKSPDTRGSRCDSSERIVVFRSFCLNPSGWAKSPFRNIGANALITSLLRERFAVLPGPVAIGGDCLHRRAALRSAGTGALHFRFSHAGTGLVVHARANVHNAF
jgi:hypothetical protein